jgi:AcrR family transcriptional regulator
MFKNKEDIFTAVFTDCLIARHPAVQQAATAQGSTYDRLLEVCRLMAIEPWGDMVETPMGNELFAACERLNSAIEALHRQVALECITTILQDR